MTSTKCYWSLLKTVLIGKKVPYIPPIFHNNMYVTDFKEKSEIFNSFFADQSSLILNNSILQSQLKLLTEHTLTSCDFSETEILQIIDSQDSNKAHERVYPNGHSFFYSKIRNFENCTQTAIRFSQQNKKFSNVPKLPFIL